MYRTKKLMAGLAVTAISAGAFAGLQAALHEPTSLNAASTHSASDLQGNVATLGLISHGGANYTPRIASDPEPCLTSKDVAGCMGKAVKNSWDKYWSGKGGTGGDAFSGLNSP